jgi:phosphonoacetaldehyde dehydrogenase
MRMLINGKLVWGEDGTFDVLNPYHGKIVGKAPIASAGQINEALDAAYNCQPNLSKTEREDILRRLATKMLDNQEELSDLITAELGVSKKASLYEACRAYNVFMMAAKAVEATDEDLTAKYEDKSAKAKLRVISEPYRLVVGITPFNHPLNQVAHKVAPAIAAGAPIVIKPSEKTPLTALKLGKLIQELVPPGMVNIVTGYPPKEIVDQLVTHPLVDLVSFTGGVDVGKYICRTMANEGKELTKTVLELGGNAALTILEDADLNLAARIALGAFDNSGQRCTAIKRIFVHENIADNFAEKFVNLTAKIIYGDPTNPDTEMGTVVNEEAAEEMQRRVNVAIEEGAELLYGNVREGALYSPTIIDYVNSHSEVVTKETFGPVAPIIRIKSEQEAIDIINSSSYKLAGAVITRSRGKAEKFATETGVGQFNWNGKPGYRTEQAPFGGFGDSGNGEKEGVICAIEGMKKMRTFYRH